MEHRQRGAASSSRVRTWWRAGARPAPWLHAVVAAVAGSVAAGAAARSSVVVFVVGLPGLAAPAVVAAIAAGVLVALAAVVTRRASAWAQLPVGVLIVVAAVVVATVRPSLAADGVSLDLSGPPPTVYVVGAVIAAVGALLAHAGPPRGLGVVLLCATVVVGVVATVVTIDPPRSPAEEAAATARAQEAMGATYRPVTVDVDGYGSIWEPTAVPGVGFVQPFSSPAEVGHGLGQQSGSDLTVSTLPLTAATCGRTLEGVGDGGAAEDETSCETRDGLVYRTSASGREVAAIDGDVLVAVAARTEVDEEVLVAAVRSARPLDDAAYRHLLFGDGDEYTGDMDGQRCPVTAVACG